MSPAEHRPERVKNIIEQPGFPPHLSESIIRVNEQLETQLAGYIGFLNRLLASAFPEGSEPRYESFSKLITKFKYPYLEILFNLQAWAGMSAKLHELFIWDSFVEEKPIRASIRLELPQRPNSSPDRPQVEINLVFSQMRVSSRPKPRGLSFRIGYMNSAPVLPGYVQQINFATRDRYDPIKETLENPQYSAVRQELFKELLEWLGKCLKEDDMRILNNK